MSKLEIDQYISDQKEPEKTLLKYMRKMILEIEPELKQGISYGIPAFKLGKDVVCGLLPDVLVAPFIHLVAQCLKP